MGETVTNLDSYVNGIKVVEVSGSSIRLVNGQVVEMGQCLFLGSDDHATYYSYSGSDALLDGEAEPAEGMIITERGWAASVLQRVAGMTDHGSYPQEISAFDLGRALGRALTNSNESEHLMLLGVEVLRGMQHYKNLKGRYLEREGTATFPRFRAINKVTEETDRIIEKLDGKE